MLIIPINPSIPNLLVGAPSERRAESAAIYLPDGTTLMRWCSPGDADRIVAAFQAMTMAVT